MGPESIASCTSFAGDRRIATGPVAEVAARTKQALNSGSAERILIFDDATGNPVEIDFRGTSEEVLRRLSPPPDERTASTEPAQIPPRRPGRPRLGVVAREVTLLPRHWEWLNDQPGGASVALRKLVDDARKRNEGRDRIRHSQEAAYRFMTAVAGDFPGFEEANRALYRGDPVAFERQIAAWPADIREYATRLSRPAFTAESRAPTDVIGANGSEDA